MIKNTILIFFLFNFSLFSINLSEIKGMEKLSNYNELKNKKIERFYEDSRLVQRKNGLLYYKDEKTPFTGVQIYRENGNIQQMYFFYNGRIQGEGFDYYENGNLALRMFFKDDIKLNAIGYYRNGIKSSELKYLENISAKNKNILDGKSLLYDKKGNLFAEMQFKNNSTVGQKQKFYENNKLKYEFIAGSELNEPAKPSEYYIEYYDNSDKVAMHCEEKPNGSWTCKEYKKDGTFKREKEYPTVIYNQRGTKDWINYLLPVLKVFGL